MTGQPNLTYIGHSQGTSQMFYALSANQDLFKSTINLIIAFAPVTRMKNASGTIKSVAEYTNEFTWGLGEAGIYDVFSPSSVNETVHSYDPLE